MYIVGITGLSCSGKTTLSEKLHRSLGKENCLLLSMDDYYKELTSEEYKILHNDEALINFDTPKRINFELMKQNLSGIKNNIPVEIPKFDLASCVITSRVTIPANKYKFIILEGCFVFSEPDVANLCNLKIWVETSDYVCALRRFKKFTQNIKGYSHDYVYNQCIKFVIPGQETFIKPLKKFCDFFVNGEKEDENYVDMIVKFISDFPKN